MQLQFSESFLPIQTGFTEVLLDWRIWGNRKDTEKDTQIQKRLEIDIKERSIVVRGHLSPLLVQ